MDTIRVNAKTFYADYYLKMYPDVKAAGVDAYRHYLDCGASDGRNPNPYFDTRWYMTTYPDVEASGVHPFIHYALIGFGQGRNPNGQIPATTYSTGMSATPDEQVSTSDLASDPKRPQSLIGRFWSYLHRFIGALQRQH